MNEQDNNLFSNKPKPADQKNAKIYLIVAGVIILIAIVLFLVIKYLLLGNIGDMYNSAETL